MKQKNVKYSLMFASILALAALSCSGAAGVANLFATDTPTDTPSPSPTPRPAGVKAEEQADGAALITDYDNHYQYSLPEDWEVVFTSQKDLQQAVQDQASADPEFADIAQGFKDMDPDVFRLAAVNVDRKYFYTSDTPTLLTVNAYEDAIASTMPMAFVTAMIEDNILKDAKNTSWDVTNNGNGVEVGIVTGGNTFSFDNGINVNVEMIVIAFQANNKLIILEIAAPQGYGKEILASFDSMINSIKIETE